VKCRCVANSVRSPSSDYDSYSHDSFLDALAAPAANIDAAPAANIDAAPVANIDAASADPSPAAAAVDAADPATDFRRFSPPT